MVYILRLLHRFKCGAVGAQSCARGNPTLYPDLRLGTSMTSLYDEIRHTIHSTCVVVGE